MGNTSATNAPVSIGHQWSSISFKCTEFRSTPVTILEVEGTVCYFQYSSVGAPNGKCQVPALHSFNSNSPLLRQWETIFIHHSVIHFSHEVYYATWESVLGTWVHTWNTRWKPGISSLNREIATASPINHNEATSGSVKVEIVLHLRKVSGQTSLK